MNKDTKLYSILSYITWLGWAFAFYKKEEGDEFLLHHLNQALVINIISTLGSAMLWTGGPLGISARVIEALTLIFHIMGIISAAQMSDKPLPVIGEIHILDK